MKLKIGSADATALVADLLVVPVFEGEAEPAGELPLPAARQLKALLAKSPFGGQEGKVRSAKAPATFAAERLLFIGLGRRGRIAALEQARRVGGRALTKLAEHGALRAVMLPPAGDAATALATLEGLLLADYSFDRHRSGSPGKKKAPEPTLTVPVPDAARAQVKRGLKAIQAGVRGTHLARDLGNEPSNVLTPAELAKRAQALARRHASAGISCRVLGLAEIRRKKMGAFLAVAQGSKLEPRFIHLRYAPKKRGRGAKTVAVVGKGLTFDSGGISIKPGGGMQDMKFDMCGAATVLGLFEALPDLGVRHEVHGFVAACDNMPSGSAYKPGDVITSMAGRTIEIINTDAEGRLTLVDALTQAQTFRPDVMVDLATLTGACMVALGPAAGIMANDQALAGALLASAEATGERAWPLPLFEDYKFQLKSDFADVKNLGDRFGGALTAGLFLSAWVDEELPWAHLDIAGSAWSGREEACCGKGATGWGVRALGHWLQGL